MNPNKFWEKALLLFLNTRHRWLRKHEIWKLSDWMVRWARAITFHVLSRKIWDSRLADQKQSPFEEKFRVILLSSNLLPRKRRKPPTCVVGLRLRVSSRPLFHVNSSNSWRVALYAMAELSTSGMFYSRGKALGEDWRRKIIQDIIDKWGDFTTWFFEGSFITIAR